MGNIKYYLNKGKGKETSRPIMISYHFSGQRLFYYTGLWIAENDFNQVSKETPAKSSCIDRIFINERLKMIRNTIGSIENEAIGRGEMLSPELFKTGLDDKFKNDSFTYIFHRTMNNTKPDYLEYLIRKQLSSPEFIHMIKQITNIEVSSLSTLFLSK